MLTVRQTADDFGRRLLARKLAEELLDVLNLERALFQFVVGDQVFHSALSPQPLALSPAISLSLLLYLCPGVAERDDPVEHRRTGGAVVVDVEVADALELKLLAARC